MRIAFNPSTVAALIAPPNNKDITFDLRGHNIFARGVKFCGTDTNTWRDIKINNVSIGSNILDLQNGSNTTLTNTNGVVTINSTWRPVVDNLTSDSTTSSLSANLGRVLKALIDGKSDSDHNHDDRYVKKTGDTMFGALNFANGTWNLVGDDVYMGDHNIGGLLCIMGANGTTGLSFHKYGDASIRKSITFDGNTLYMNGSCDYATLSNLTNLLAINTVPNKTTATSIGSWSPISGRYVFHQKWTDTSTGGDSADFGIYLDGNLTANMVLDGYYNSLLGFRVIGATSGFLKANGTIDNSTYLTSHLSLSNYYTKSEVDTKLNSKLNYRLFWERTNIDLNSITEAWHTYEVNNGTGTANTPTNASWHLAVLWGTGDTDYAVLLCTAYTSNYSLYLRHKIAGKWYNWIQLAATTDIPTSLKNPHALTISLNGTSQGPYDGSAAKNINITPSSIGAATSGHNHDGRYVYNYGGTQMDGASINKNALGMTTNSGITEDWWHILQAAWNGEYRWNSLIAFPTLNRNGMYYRSGLDDNTAWGAWVKLLDVNNYSSTLDSRYYTESEVDSLLNAKLNRQNLSYGTWNPRGYNLAADYLYNGGDLSISESRGLIHVSVDGYFWLNEGQYRVLDTSDVAGLKDNLTVHLYLSNTDTTWWPLIWGGSSHNNTSDSTGTVYKSYDKLSWLTSSLTLYATHLKTTDLNTLTALFHPGNDSTLKIYSGRTLDAVSDGHIGLQTSIDNTDGETHTHPTLYGSRCVLALLPRGGSVYIGNMPNGGNGRKLNVNGDIGLFNVGSIRDLTIGGGIYWNPYVESTTDGTDAASITLVRLGVAGGTTLVLSLMNDANDTILFQTNGSARLYHNSYPILTTLNTYVSNNKGYINGTEITLVNNADTVDNYHETAFPRLVGIKGNTWNWNDVIRAGYYKIQSGTITNHPSGIYPFGMAEVITTENHNDGENRELQIYYPHSQTNNIAIWLRMHNSSTQGNGWGSWVGVPNTNGNIASATKLQTSRLLWGQSFNGTANVDNTLRIKQTTGNYCEGIRIQNGDNTWATIILGATGDSGTNANAWSIHRKSDNNFAISRNSSDGANGLVMTSVGMGLGTTAPEHRLDVVGNIRATGQLFLPTNGNYNAILMGDDCWMGDCNIGDVIGLSGRNNANAGGIKFGKGGMYIGYNGSSHYSSDTSLWSNFNADLLDGYHENSFLRYRGATSTDLEVTLWNLIGIKEYYGALPDGLTDIYNWGGVISLSGTYSRFEIYAAHLASSGTGLYYRSGWDSDKRTWLKFIDSSNIGSQSVNYANSAGNADTATNAYHLRINSADTWSTWYWSGLGGLPSWLWGSNDGTNMYVWNPSNFNVNTALYLRSLGNLNCQTGRTLNYGDVYSYNTYGNTGAPTNYTSVIGFGRGTAGTVEIAGGWCNTGLYWRSLRDCCEDWFSWRTVLDSSNYTEFINNYYWANVKISASSSTTTSPTVHTLTATRVCAGHNPEIDNSISCSNWFRSSGDTGWYNTTYRGGWYMSDTSWIRAHNNVGIYTGGQIYSSNSIRMGNILLEHTDEINNITNGNIYLNYRNSGNISLCQGGGNVGIGTTSPSYKLHVNGNIYSSGQIIREGYSTIWALGRNVALLRETTAPGYHTLWSLKTTNGSWDFGEYNTSGWYNVPVLSYITDSNYNSGNNATTYQIKFPLASGTVALTSFGGDSSHPIFLGYLNLDHGNDGTVSSSFYCLGYSVPFTYTRGGNYCRIYIPDTPYQTFYIRAAIASVNYSGGGMDTWVGDHRGDGAWWLHCYASGLNEVRVKGFCLRNSNNDSWWGGNPLWSGNSGANKITVCIFGNVTIR